MSMYTFFSTVIVILLAYKVFRSCSNMVLSISMIKKRSVSFCPSSFSKKHRVLVLIPVLREQSIITDTLEYFSQLNCSGVELHIVICGTIRESFQKKEKARDIGALYWNFKNTFDASALVAILINYFSEKSAKYLIAKQDEVTLEQFVAFYEGQKSTKELAESWIQSWENRKHAESLFFHYAEAKDLGGDRASQLNYGVDWFCNSLSDDVDLVGVYDADSRPEQDSILEAVQIVCEKKVATCCQLLHFVDFANRLSFSHGSPLMVANALNQTTWSVIREYPSTINYFQFSKDFPDKVYGQNVYLCGHGQFLHKSVYDEFFFPEDVITDGIQLGYRLSMSNVPISDMQTFCKDEAPTSASQLIIQHSRWFGGCMKLFSAYKWSKERYRTKAILQLVSGFMSQAAWAYAPLLVILGFCGAVFTPDVYRYILLMLYFVFLFIYCYVIPFCSCKIFGIPLQLRMVDWLCIPAAMILKSLGPQIYFFNKIKSAVYNKKMTFAKVER